MWGFVRGLALLAPLTVVALIHPGEPPAAPAAAIYPRFDLTDVPAADVLRIVDGDTLLVRSGGKTHRVHLLGVKAAAGNTVAGRAAQVFLRNLLEGERVQLIESAEGELSGRVRVFRVPDGLFVNLECVRQGYARVHPALEEPQRSLFDIYEKRARTAGKGLWHSPVSGDAAPAAPETVTAPVERDGVVGADLSGTVYKTRTGRKYHRADCSSCRRGATAVSRADARRGGLEPCRRCHPDRAE